jgi:hypothetical protein
MTIKELITKLEKIDNKYLEVEMILPSSQPYPIEKIFHHKTNRKVYLFSFNKL